jgi:hypothetical protein
LKLLWFFIPFVFVSFSLKAQHSITVDALLNTEDHTVHIQQQIEYRNTSETTLSEIYLNDWANSFSSKNTPLAKRFSENFRSAFHFEKDENRGRTDIDSITDKNDISLDWERGTEVDVVKINLGTPLAPGEVYTINLSYVVKLPEDRFTRFGVTIENNYRLKYWLITPSVFDGKWHAYSNKNTDDYFQYPTHFSITFTFPSHYQLFTDLNIVEEQTLQNEKQLKLEGDQRMHTDLYLEQFPTFKSVATDQVQVVTNLRDEKVSPAINALLVDRVTRYLNEKLGPYPFRKIIISEADYRNSPVYGLNQLPDFISPFPNGFELDAELFKTISRKYITNTLPINPRNDHWLIGALQIYLMMEYMDAYYPEMKILGSVSDFWIIKWSHASDLEFNDQYSLLYLNMARNNLHQSLSTPKDSLLKFNKNIASDYYAGMGFQYLSDYIGKPELGKSIRDYFGEYRFTPTSPVDFQNFVSENTSLPINWFFEDYVSKRTTIDFIIDNVEDAGDSLGVTIANRKDNIMPVSIYGLNKDEVLFKKWVGPVDGTTEVMVPKKNVEKLVINYEGIIPEFNRRNNTKKVKGLLNRPVQIRFFQDVEDPNYNQMFVMPEFKYNLYDGFSIGPKLYNKTFLPRKLHYRLTPLYGFRSKKIIGSGSIVYTERLDKRKLYSTRYGIAGSIFSYNQGLFYKRLSPFVTFAFRDNADLRKNKKVFLNFRHVTVQRDLDPNLPLQEPNYSVFNTKFVHSDNNLINFYRGVLDYQLSEKFSKIAAQFEYRKLFNNNRQLNLRLYVGMFVFNHTEEDDDFFSFALDRPTDYLFDYNYYGRSEDSGLFSQQLIIAEGGFKSQLEPAFSNQFIATLNGSTNIWKWIYAYGDVGVIKNKGDVVKGVWDTGIRASFVTDYFELYFPLYSSLGWEPGLPNYDQKIRFIVTLDINTLLRLFTREWY